MKNLIKSVVIVGACLAASFAMAQQGGTKGPQNGTKPNMPSSAQLDKMMAAAKDAHKKAVDSVGLSADQKKKVAAADAKHLDKLANMQKAFYKQMMASQGKQDPNTQKSMKALTDEAKAYETELKAAMGDAKFKAYREAVNKEMAKVMKNMNPGGKGN